ncbi:MAG: TauD/TfdA family dioxygenase, partial [Gammaproteobacteria bacterium]
MTYRQIQVEPAIGALGAEIGGVDLSSPLSPDIVRELRRAWLDHLVLFFRDQTLQPDDQTRFAEYFGELDVYPFVEPLPGEARARCRARAARIDPPRRSQRRERRSPVPP